MPTKKEKMSAARKSNVLDTPNKAGPRKAKQAESATSNGAGEATPAHTGMGAPAHTAPVAAQAPVSAPVPAGPALPAVSTLVIIPPIHFSLFLEHLDNQWSNFKQSNIFHLILARFCPILQDNHPLS